MADLFREPATETPYNVLGDVTLTHTTFEDVGDGEKGCPESEEFDALSDDFVAGHDAGYLTGVMDSAATAAHTARAHHLAGVRAGRRQYGRDVLALAFAAFAAFLAGELLGAALTPFVSPRGGVR